jgi:predicted RND superfamily exporter protein
VISALTTTVSFGNLAFSPHPGTASMGLLLTLGMVAIVAATLLLLPAMVQLMDRSRVAGPR